MKLEFESNTTTASPFAAANSVITAAFADKEKTVAQLLQAGVKAAQEGNRTEARRTLLQVTEADPRSENAWLWLASISEYPEELLVFLNNVLDINPHNARALEWAQATKSLLAKNFVQRGINASNEAQMDLAKQCFSQATAHDESNEMAWFWMASIAESADEKLAHLQKVLSLNPENEIAKASLQTVKNQVTESLLRKANIAAISGEREAASEMLRGILEQTPESEEAWILKSYLAESFSEKITCFERVLTLNPENDAAMSGLASLREMMARAENKKAQNLAAIAAHLSATPDRDQTEEAAAAAFEMSNDYAEFGEIIEGAEIVGETIEVSPEAVEFTVETSAAEDHPTERLAVFPAMLEMENEYVSYAGEEVPKVYQAAEVIEEVSEEKELVAAEELITEEKFITEEILGEEEEIVAAEETVVTADDEKTVAAQETVTEEKEFVEEVSAQRFVKVETAEKEFAGETSESAALNDTDFSAPENFATAVSATEVLAPEVSAPHFDGYRSNSDSPKTDYFVQTNASDQKQAESHQAESHQAENFSGGSYRKESNFVSLPTAPVSPPAPKINAETLLACPFCNAGNELNEFVCNVCRTVLTLSNLELMLAQTEADTEFLSLAVKRLEAEKETRELDLSELKTLAIGYINLKNLRQGISHLQAAWRMNLNDVVLASQINSLKIRLAEIEQQESAHSSLTRGKKIMVVDDSATVRKLISSKLEKSGHDVVCAVDGIEALEKIKEFTPDLILLDIMMPQMDGYQVCKYIRSNDATKDIPVVMISGKDGFFDKVRGRMSGSTGYITKPFGPETLMKTVESYII